MNTKRQTIWLVSMLSLMVVLSAYYLFTQDMDDTDKLTDSQQPGYNVAEVTAGDGDFVVNEVLQPGDSADIGLLDQQVLEQLEREGFANGGLFSELLAKREMKYEEEENRIMKVIADVSNDLELSAAAFAEYEQLEEKDSRIQSLESELTKKYDIAIIDENNDRYNVVVRSEKLEKKEAANIIEQVMNTMEVKMDQVSVQYVQ